MVGGAGKANIDVERTRACCGLVVKYSTSCIHCFCGNRVSWMKFVCQPVMIAKMVMICSLASSSKWPQIG